MLEVELPKDVLARGPTALSPELIALLDEQLRMEQTKQRALYEAEVAAKGAKAAAAAGVAADWAPPEQPEEAGYLADGDLSLYSEEMLARRQRLRAHPGVVEAIRAWWAWLPKDRVQVFEPDESAEAAASDATTATTTPASDATTATTTTTGDASTSATPAKPAAGGGKRVVPLLGRESPQHAGRGSPLPSAPGGASSSRSASPTPTPTKLGSASTSAADAVPPQPPSRTVLGVVKPVYCAFVVVIQLLLLPRYGLEPDPAYDPEEDWQEDNKGEEGPLEYDRFFDALFQLADLWVDGVVAWDYARLLADLLQDMQLHERESLLFSRVMQRFGYVPYYPEWLANGPQFVAPRAIGEMDVDAEAAWQAEDEAAEQRAHEERLAREEAEEEEEEGSSDEGSEEEEGDGGQEGGDGGGAREKEETERKVELVRKIMRPAVESSKAATKAGALKAAAGAKRPAPHPHAEGHASLWTAARKAKILGLTRNFALVSRLLLELQAPRRLPAALLEAAAAAPQPHHPHPDPDEGSLRKASGLRAMRSRLGAAPAGPTPATDAPYKRPPRVLHMATAPIDKRSRGGRLWKAPPASLPVRHRSPPGTRKARAMPQLPLVQEHLYYILPRYVTYSDQLPDRVAHRPHTAPPDLEQQQEPEAEAAAAAATVGTSGRSQGPGQGDRQSSPLLGALPSPRLACTPLQLTLPPSRRGRGVGPTPLGLAGTGPGPGPSSSGAYVFGVSPLPSPSHAGSSPRGHLMSRGLNQSPLPSPSGFLSPTPGSGPAFGDRQHPGAEGGDAEAGGWAAAAAEQLLDTFQAAPAAREQLWARVGRGASPSPHRPSSHPSYRPPSLSKSWDSGGGEALLQHHLNKVQSPPPSAGAASASSLSPSPLPPLRTSALANGGLPHAPSGDLDHPWTPPTPLPASRLSRRSGASVSLSATQPRSRNTRSTSGVAQSLAGYLGFVERIAPGCPKFYHHRHHRAGPGALSRDATPQTEFTGLSMT